MGKLFVVCEITGTQLPVLPGSIRSIIDRPLHVGMNGSSRPSDPKQVLATTRRTAAIITEGSTNDARNLHKSLARRHLLLPSCASFVRRKRSRDGGWWKWLREPPNGSFLDHSNPGAGRKKAAIVAVTTTIGVTFLLVLLHMEMETPSVSSSPLIYLNNLNHTNTNHIVLDHGVIARAYVPWGDRALPCFVPEEPHNNQPVSLPHVHQGFLFMKLMKTGGSTAAGVNIRIMKQVAQQQMKREPSSHSNHFSFCQGRFEHAWGYEMLAGPGEDPARRFAWTIVREPTPRAISQFFHFVVSRQESGHSDFLFQKYLWSEKKRLSSYYLQVLSEERTSVTNANSTSIINKILSDYNFIGVTERMDETLVALMMILNVPMGTIMYLKSKTSGGYDDGGTGSCVYIQPSHLSSGMKAFFAHARWNEVVQWDNLLYQAVNRSLDLTIAGLGEAKFQENLSRFRQALQMAQDRCLPREVFPCTSSGRKNPKKSCLWKDSGCGSDCLDEVATELGLW